MHTNTLSKKKEFALSRGYILEEQTNFNVYATVTVRDIETNRQFLVGWGHFRQGATPVRTTLAQKKADVEREGYLLLAEENFKVNDKVLFQNKATGAQFETRYTDFIRKGYREPTVGFLSIGEAMIKGFLETNLKDGCTFIPQYRVDLPHKKLFYDFAIMKNDTLVKLIEYNGVQHYTPSTKFGMESFERTKQSDALKEEYALDIGVPLCVIPYTVSTTTAISEVLAKELSEFVVKPLKEFSVVRSDNTATTLQEKKDFAKTRGFLLEEEANFPHVAKVRLKRASDGFIWDTRWHEFTKGALPRKEAMAKRMQSSLEEKKKVAEYLGYSLQEEHNFSVKAKVKLKDLETGELHTFVWESLMARYKRKQRRNPLQ